MNNSMMINDKYSVGYLVFGEDITTSGIIRHQVFPLLKELTATLQVPVHLISIIRNEFDYKPDVLLALARELEPFRITLTALKQNEFVLARLGEMAIYNQIKLMHCRSYSSSQHALFLQQHLQLPFIFDVRGLMPEEHKLIRDEKAGRVIPPNEDVDYQQIKELEKSLVENADSTVTLNRSFAENLQNKYPYLRRMDIINNFVDIEYFHWDPETRTRLRRELDWNDDDLAFAFSGSMSPWYDFPMVVRWARVFQDAGISARFLILTYIDESAKIGHPRQFFAELFAQNNVDPERFEFRSSDEHPVPDWLSACDAALIPHKKTYYDILYFAQPIKFAEYLASGLPVLTNDVSVEMEEIIRSQDGAGIVLPDGEFSPAAVDWVRQLQLALRQDRAGFRANIAALAERLYSLTETAGKYRRLYEDLVPELIPADRPQVSIIIPVFNKSEYTERCLRSLRANVTGVEIIVVDNGSTDGTLAMLQRFPEVRVVHSDENLGFARGCNLGAESATTCILLFLNNDTEVRPGWLEPLIEEIQSHPEVGAVGSKLLYPNGDLQHGGVYIAADFRPNHLYLPFGVSGDFPAVNHRRELQAVTAASIAIRRKVFQQLGGFDPAYLNGYEDVDLCLRIRELGYKIIYRPDSLAIHHESVSMGPEKQAIIDRNSVVFLDRWKGRVKTDRFYLYAQDGWYQAVVEDKEGKHACVLDPFPVKAKGPRPRVLVMSIDNPYSACPYLRIVQVMQELAERGDIEFAWLRPEQRDGRWVVPNRFNGDILIVQRTMPAQLARDTVFYARLCGLKIIYELDDDLLNLPSEHPDQAAFAALRPHLEAMLRDCDLVTTSTEVLKQRFERYHGEVAVLPNLLDPRVWPQTPVPRPAHDRVCIACTGTPSHRLDFAPIVPVIRSLAERYRGHVEFVFRGFAPEGLQVSPEIRIEPELLGDYREYARMLQTGGFDLALVPLLNNSLNEGKSNIKYLEYSACHIPGIYSKSTAYKDIRGISAESRTDAWFGAACRLIEDAELRSRLAETAFRHAWDEYSLPARAKLWKAAIDHCLSS